MGVPFFLFDRRYPVAGAQPRDVLLDLLGRVWAEVQPPGSVTAPGGP